MNPKSDISNPKSKDPDPATRIAQPVTRTAQPETLLAQDSFQQAFCLFFNRFYFLLFQHFFQFFEKKGKVGIFCPGLRHNEPILCFDPLAVIRGSRRDAKPELKMADSYGTFSLEIRETERVRIELGEGTDYKGFLVVGDKLRPLPIGSTLNKEKGTFSWHPGPGFIGEYNFTFLVQDETSSMKRISVRINIVPKFSSY